MFKHWLIVKGEKRPHPPTDFSESDSLGGHDQSSSSDEGLTIIYFLTIFYKSTHKKIGVIYFYLPYFLQKKFPDGRPVHCCNKIMRENVTIFLS